MKNAAAASLKWDRSEQRFALAQNSVGGFRRTNIKSDGPFLMVQNALWFRFDVSSKLGAKRWKGAGSVKGGTFPCTISGDKTSDRQS